MLGDTAFKTKGDFSKKHSTPIVLPAGMATSIPIRDLDNAPLSKNSLKCFQLKPQQHQQHKYSPEKISYS